MTKLSYSEAKKELQAIVKSIEEGEMEVDALISKVKYASELFSICKEKLVITDKEIEKLLNEMT